MLDEMKEIISDFITEAEETLDNISRLFIELEAKAEDKDILQGIFRGMHTLKGAAGFLGFQPIVDISHRAENILKKLMADELSISTYLMDILLKSTDMLKLLIQHIKLEDGKQEDISSLLKALDDASNDALNSQSQIAEQKTSAIEHTTMPNHKPDQKGDIALKESPQTTIRIDVERVDKVMNLSGEMVLVRNRLLNIAHYLEEKYSDDDAVRDLIDTMSFFDIVTSDMQLAVMKMRMQPLKKVFGKFPRVVRDLANNLGKQVDLIISGEETEVDKSVIEHIGDPLVHIIRNAIDHGIEPTDERLNKGKSEKGTINLSACQQGNNIIITVSDDGRGINIEKVKQKAFKKGLITEDELLKMTDEAAINLIFLPGFSTNEVATEISGRGVGMDVVRTNISKLNGYVDVQTNKDLGTTFKIMLPLTLAIINALMIRVGDARFAIPLAPIEEILKVRSNDISYVGGQKVIVVRGRVLPYFELSDVLGFYHQICLEQRYALITAIGDKRFCIAVDELLGQEEVVIKTVEGLNLSSFLIAGATITGEGKVVFIIDTAGISRTIFETTAQWEG